MSSWLNWFWDILWKLDLYQKNAKVLLLGLDNAGKTTLLYRLKDDRLAVHYPTMQPNMEQLSIASVKFNTWDLGGHEIARKLWRDYFPEVDCICFLVDSSNRERMAESKKELDLLLAEDALQDVPFVVLGNKIDLPQACGEDELRERLGLQHTSGKGGGCPEGIRPIEIFMCSVLSSQGYGDGFRWVSQFL